MDRKYSVAEIDKMRRALRLTEEWSDGVNWYALDQRIEDRLRTYMTNGTDPDELYDSQLKQHEAIEKSRAQMERDMQAIMERSPCSTTPTAS